MSGISPILVVENKTSKRLTDMAKIEIKSDRITPFGGIFSVMEQFDSMLSQTIDTTLGLRCRSYGYRYSEIIRSLMCVYFCGGTCVEDVTSHLMPHLSLHPTLRTCSSDTILVEKWKGKAHRLVIQRQRRVDGETDLWEGEYTYRCILTNDFGTLAMDIVEFYNLRGGKERILDDMGNGFGWGRRRIRSAPYGPMTAYCLKTHRGVRGFCATETPKCHSLRPEGIFPACYFGTLYSCRSVADLRKESTFISNNLLIRVNLNQESTNTLTFTITNFPSLLNES